MATKGGNLMQDSIWNIDIDLKAWAEWSRYQSGAKIGYPTIQPFTRLLPDNIGYVPDYSINEDYAMVIDRMVANLNPLNNDLFLVVQLYYLHRKNQRKIAEILRCSEQKIKQKLSTAREVIKFMVHITQVDSVNDD